MELTVLVAKVLGIYLVVSGLFLIVKGKTVPHLLKDFFNHPAVMYLTGAILVLLSSMYLLEHNDWSGGWNTPVTILVWLVFLKGITYIFAPQALSEMALKQSKKLFSTYGVIAILVGIWLFFVV